jgi:hypothetical protein
MEFKKIPPKLVFIMFSLHWIAACESGTFYSGEPAKEKKSIDSVTPAANSKETTSKAQGAGSNGETFTMRGTTQFNKYHMLMDFDLGDLNSLGGARLTGTFGGICVAFDKPLEGMEAAKGPPLLKGPCPETLMVGDVKSRLWISCPAESFPDPRDPQIKVQPLSQNFIYDHMFVIKRNSRGVAEAKLHATKDLLGGRSNLSVEDTCKEIYKTMPGGSI